MGWQHVVIKGVRSSDKAKSARLIFFCQSASGDDVTFSTWCNARGKDGDADFSPPAHLLMAMMLKPHDFAAYYNKVLKGLTSDIGDDITAFKKLINKAARIMAKAFTEGNLAKMQTVAKGFDDNLSGRVVLIDMVTNDEGFTEVANHACPVAFSVHDQVNLPLEQRPFGNKTIAQIVAEFREAGGKSLDEMVHTAQAALVDLPQGEVATVIPVAPAIAAKAGGEAAAAAPAATAPAAAAPAAPAPRPLAAPPPQAAPVQAAPATAAPAADPYDDEDVF